MSELSQTDKNQQAADSLSAALMTGLVNQEQIAEANRLIQIMFAQHAINGVSLLMKTLKPIVDTQEALTRRYQEILQEQIEGGMINTLDDIQSILEFNNKTLINSLEVVRKYIQGKELLSNYPTLTEEEKGIIKMLKSFKTKEEKDIFIDTLRQSIDTVHAQQKAKDEETESEETENEETESSEKGISEDEF